MQTNYRDFHVLEVGKLLAGATAAPVQKQQPISQIHLVHTPSFHPITISPIKILKRIPLRINIRKDCDETNNSRQIAWQNLHHIIQILQHILHTSPTVPDCPRQQLQNVVTTIKQEVSRIRLVFQAIDPDMQFAYCGPTPIIQGFLNICSSSTLKRDNLSTSLQQIIANIFDTESAIGILDVVKVFGFTKLQLISPPRNHQLETNNSLYEQRLNLIYNSIAENHSHKTMASSISCVNLADEGHHDTTILHWNPDLGDFCSQFPVEEKMMNKYPKKIGMIEMEVKLENNQRFVVILHRSSRQVLVAKGSEKHDIKLPKTIVDSSMVKAFDLQPCFDCPGQRSIQLYPCFNNSTAIVGSYQDDFHVSVDNTPWIFRPFSCLDQDSKRIVKSIWKDWKHGVYFSKRLKIRSQRKEVAIKEVSQTLQFDTEVNFFQHLDKDHLLDSTEDIQRTEILSKPKMPITFHTPEMITHQFCAFNPPTQHQILWRFYCLGITRIPEGVIEGYHVARWVFPLLKPNQSYQLPTKIDHTKAQTINNSQEQQWKARLDGLAPSTNSNKVTYHQITKLLAEKTRSEAPTNLSLLAPALNNTKLVMLEKAYLDTNFELPQWIHLIVGVFSDKSQFGHRVCIANPSCSLATLLWSRIGFVPVPTLGFDFTSKRFPKSGKDFDFLVMVILRQNMEDAWKRLDKFNCPLAIYAPVICKTESWFPFSDFQTIYLQSTFHVIRDHKEDKSPFSIRMAWYLKKFNLPSDELWTTDGQVFWSVRGGVLSKIPLKITTTPLPLQSVINERKNISIITWNLNGLRSTLKRNLFFPFLRRWQPDILCLGETKISKERVQYLPGFEATLSDMGYYWCYWHSCSYNIGYSGVAILSRIAPLCVIEGVGNDVIDREGRIISAQFTNFTLINCYSPCSGMELQAMPKRKLFDQVITKYLQNLPLPIIWSGDLNVAYRSNDVWDGRSNKARESWPGFTSEERQRFIELTKKLKLVDAYAHFHGQDDPPCYTYFEHDFRRWRNQGWRLDYFMASSSLFKHSSAGKISSFQVLTSIRGSDHVPIRIELQECILPRAGEGLKITSNKYPNTETTNLAATNLVEGENPPFEEPLLQPLPEVDEEFCRLMSI